MRLANQDRQAIDLMLDHGTTADGNGDGASSFVTPPTNDQMRHRVSTVGKILSMLAEMPAGDPPSDLVARTMRHIDHAGMDLSTREISVPPLFRTDRPVA